MTVFCTLNPDDLSSGGESSFTSEDSDFSSLSLDSLKNSLQIPKSLEINGHNGVVNNCDECGDDGDVTIIRFIDEHVTNNADSGCTWNDRDSRITSNNIASFADRTAKENNVNANNIIRNAPVLETRHQSAQTDNSYETLREKRIDDTIQGLSVAVQYLAHEVNFIKFISSTCSKSYCFELVTVPYFFSQQVELARNDFTVCINEKV